MAFIGQTIGIAFSPDLILQEVPCDASVIVGDWVRLNSSGIAVKAQANSIANSHVVGVVEDKATSVLCRIRIGGISKTIFSTLDVTKVYFLSPSNPGEMTTVVPVGSGEVVLNLGQPVDTERFIVHKKLALQRA